MTADRTEPTTNAGCWYGQPHAPVVRQGLGCGTSVGTTVWGPSYCMSCGVMLGGTSQ